MRPLRRPASVAATFILLVAVAAHEVAYTAPPREASPTRGSRRVAAEAPATARIVAATLTPTSAEIERRRRAGGSLLLRSGAFDPLREAAPQRLKRGTLLDALEGGDGPYWIAQFKESLPRSARQALGAQGVAFLDPIPTHGFVVRAEGAALAALRLEPRLRWLGPFLDVHKLDPLLRGGGWQGTVVVELELFPGESGYKVLAALERPGRTLLDARPLGAVAEGQRMRVAVEADQLAAFAIDAAQLDGVRHVAPWFPPRLHNANAVWVLQSYDTSALGQLNYSLSATLWNAGITGQGQLVAVADSGLDRDMAFFRYGGLAGDLTNAQSLVPPATGTVDLTKKVAAYYTLPGAVAYDTGNLCGSTPTQFHGTHVSGSVAGNNYLNPSPRDLGVQGLGGVGNGMAPNAQLVFQDAGDADGCLTGLGNDFALIVKQAYDAGARIHSNSWGGSVPGTYTSDARAADLAMWTHEDLLLLFSAGNEGPGAQTIGTPASAKSVLTVGATVQAFADPANPFLPTSLVSFSSRGPTADGRLKPDVVTTGQSIESASGNNSLSNDATLQSLDGTSMATPLVAGGMALLRQYLIDGYYPGGLFDGANATTPSGALLKALAVAGAVDVTTLRGTGPTADILDSFTPGPSQGFGRALLDTAVYLPGDARRTRLWDRYREQGLRTGEVASHSLEVAAGQALKVVLAWSDPPGSTTAALALVNDLDLELVDPSGNVLLGNTALTGGARDILNPVEVVFVAAPAAGTWTLRVRASDVPGVPGLAGSDRQGFALVATYGDCASSPVEIPLNVVAANDPSGIALTWDEIPAATGYQIYRAPGATEADPATYRLVGTTAAPGFIDSSAVGGFGYAYVVRATTACGEGPPSFPSPALVSQAGCGLPPEFDGATAATATPGTGCSIGVSWNAATSACPLGAGLVYNVYRGTTPYFSPDAGSLLAAGVVGTSYVDTTAMPLRTYHYLVRAVETASGVDDGNTTTVPAIAVGSGSTPGTYSDNPDSAGYLQLAAPWTITNQQNNTLGGALAYHAGRDGTNYPALACAAATTPALNIQNVAGTPVLSYAVRYNLETGWDGVVVEITTNGGGTWTPITPVGNYPGSFSATESTPGVPLNACGYPKTQGAFSGPGDNSTPSLWQTYQHDLTAFKGRTVQLRWRFSSDEFTEYEGFYLDDIQVTLASTPAGCAMRDGSLRFDRGSYRCDGDTIRISLDDTDLRNAGTASVALASGRESKSVVLAETPAASGSFTGTITSSSLAPGLDGRLSCADGATLVASYNDASAAVVRTDSALVDCRGPQIAGIAADVVPPGGSAIVRWSTDEPATAAVRYGTSAPPASLAVAPSPASTSAAVTLGGLANCTNYLFAVQASDSLGNATLDDNGGQYYALATPGRTLAFGPDAVDRATTTWRSAMTSGSAANQWHRSECAARSLGDRAWRAGRPDCATVDAAATTTLTSGTINLGDGGYDLVFDEDYETGSTDTLAVEASSDGGSTWTTLASTSGSSSGWRTRVVSALRTFVGPVRVRFRSSSGPTPSGRGWAIDNIEVSRAGLCAPQPRISSRPLADVCAVGGSGSKDGQLAAGEGLVLELRVTNTGTAMGGSGTATLVSNTPALTVTRGTSSFPALPARATAALDSPLGVHASAALVCGSSASLTVTLSGGGASDATETIVVPTGRLVSPLSGLLIEDFLGTAAGTLPEGWSRAGATSGQFEGTTSVGCPVPAAAAPGDADGAASVLADTWFFSPAIAVEAGVQYNVRFDTNASGSGGARLTLYLASAATIPDPLPSIAFAFDLTPPSPCTQRTVQFTAPSTGSAYLAFRLQTASGQTDRPTVVLDDVLVDRLASCVAPRCTTGTCVGNPDDVLVAASGTTNLCSALEGTTLTATPVGGTAPFSYEWLKDGLPVPGGSAPTLTVAGSDAGGYSVRATGSGCATPTVSSVPVVVSVQAAPAFGGLVNAIGSVGGDCAATLDWAPTVAACGATPRYRIHRSTSADFTPDGSNLLAEIAGARQFVDRDALQPDTTYHYVVRAADPTTGLADGNSLVRSATPTGCFPGTAPGLDPATAPTEVGCTVNGGSSAPLLVARGAGAGVNALFSPGTGATDHTAYIGVGKPTGALRWERAVCGLGPSGNAWIDTGDPAPGSLLYFVVVGRNDNIEGSYGRSSSGLERPAATLDHPCARPRVLNSSVVCP